MFINILTKKRIDTNFYRKVAQREKAQSSAEKPVGQFSKIKIILNLRNFSAKISGKNTPHFIGTFDNKKKINT